MFRSRDRPFDSMCSIIKVAPASTAPQIDVYRPDFGGLGAPGVGSCAALMAGRDAGGLHAAAGSFCWGLCPGVAGAPQALRMCQLLNFRLSGRNRRAHARTASRKRPLHARSWGINRKTILSSCGTRPGSLGLINVLLNIRLDKSRFSLTNHRVPHCSRELAARRTPSRHCSSRLDTSKLGLAAAWTALPAATWSLRMCATMPSRCCHCCTRSAQ